MSRRLPLSWAELTLQTVLPQTSGFFGAAFCHSLRKLHSSPELGLQQQHDLTSRTVEHVNFQNRLLPASVTIFEVGPRDGLQNEAKHIPTATKVEFVNRLSACGLKYIEATSFVSPKWVPQLADGGAVMQQITRHRAVAYPVLVPNKKGLDAAVAAGATHVAIFGSASEAFSKANLNCTIAESLGRFDAVVSAAKAAGVAIRGYVSCAVGCPLQGAVEPQAAADVAQALHQMGCYQVSMADTIGVGNPRSVSAMFEATMRVVPVERLAAHLHDTYGQALANLLASLQLGVRTIDSSVAGLGGCPYAKGATGNVATEDVLYMLDGLGVHHGVQWGPLLEASQFIGHALGRPNESRAARAMLAKLNAEKAKLTAGEAK